MGRVNVIFTIRYPNEQESWLYNDDITANELVYYAQLGKVSRLINGKVKVTLGEEDAKRYRFQIGLSK